MRTWRRDERALLEAELHVADPLGDEMLSWHRYTTEAEKLKPPAEKEELWMQ